MLVRRACIGLAVLLGSSHILASNSLDIQHEIYLTANAGIFTGNFNNNYTDTTDLIPIDVAGVSVVQNGATGGIGLGYNAILADKYLLGAAIVQNFNSKQITFSTGSNGMVLSDTSSINNNLDIIIKPGIKITERFAAYLNGGLSLAYLKNNLVSLANYILPAYTTYNNNKHLIGYVVGIGAKFDLMQHVGVFAEYNYRDYGTVSLPNFDNLTATYSRSGRITTNAVTCGLTWTF